MKLDFTKMHGCGNDYIYVNGFELDFEKAIKVKLAKTLSDRHFGIGADGLIFINPSSVADFEMEMYNADGSRAEMCGNGIRCVAKYVYDRKMVNKEEFVIESMGNRKIINVSVKDGLVETVRVDMGAPILKPELIPVVSSDETFIDNPVNIDGKTYKMTCVSMGNPHAVIFHNPEDVLSLGPFVENNSIFPKRVNAEFVEILDRKNVRMRVWERGTGETLCCGTGCCATTVACILNGYTDNEITVHVPGGKIDVLWNKEDNHIYMTGPATTVFDGSVEIEV